MDKLHCLLLIVQCSYEYASRSAHGKSKKKSSHKSDSDSNSKHRRKKSRSRSPDKKTNSSMPGEPVTALLLEERLKKKEERR